MFTRKEDESELSSYMPGNSSVASHSSSDPVSAPSSSAKEMNVISKGTLIQGDLRCEGDLRIEGEVKGTIYSRSKVVIGSDGFVNGDLECVHAEVLGRVKGSLKVQDHLYLRGDAKMEGDVLTTHFEMEPSVRFNGKCTMQDKVELSSFTKQEEKASVSTSKPTGSTSSIPDKPAGNPIKTNGEKENKTPNGIFQKQTV